MSVQATSWVLRDGPKMTDVDRTGKPYGLRARGYRAVLFTIADAANRDGEHAYPGNAAIVEGSLYSRRQALAIIKELIAEAWLDVTEQGNGRGNATVYRVLMDRRAAARASADDTTDETVRSPHGSDDTGTVRSPSHSSTVGNGAVIAPFPIANSAVSDTKQCDEQTETVRRGDIAHYSQPKTSTTTQPPPASPPVVAAPRATDDPVKARARALAVLAMEQPVKPVLRDGGKDRTFPAVMAMFEQLLRGGTIVGDIERAITTGIAVWTIAGVQTAIARSKTNAYAGARDASYDALRSARERAAAEDEADAAVAAS